MDADTKAIMEFLANDPEDPVGALAANLGDNGLPPGVVVRVGRCKPGSDSDDEEEDLPSILRQIAEMEGKESSEAGSSTPPKKAESATGEPKEDVDEVVERVKNSKLSSHEKDLLSAIVDTAQIEATFDSVCLPDDTIDMLRSMVSLPLMCPEEFQTGLLKQYTMSGALLFGPPGTGKTLLAQALAKESGARMISVKPSDILHMCVGQSERLVKALFSLARKLKPCVVFIDELDALFGARTHAGQQNSARWHTSMLTEFMSEMDGLISSQVIVIGATNRPADLDDAVLRRLPCRILVDLPERDARRDILRVLLRDETLADDVKLESLADRTAKYSGSDLKNVCLAAAFNAVKENVDLPWKSGARVDPSGKGKAPAYGRPFKRFEEVDESTESRPSSPKKSPAGNGRVIAERHFARALTEIAPSSSTDTQSSRELHGWNAKFGSGANKSSSGIGLGGLGAGMGGGYGGVPSYTPGGGATSGVPSYLNRPGTSGAPSYLNRETSGIGGSSGIGAGGEGASRFGSAGGPKFGGSLGGGGGFGGMGDMGGLGGMGGMGSMNSMGGIGGSGMSGMGGLSGMGSIGGTSAMGGAGGLGGMNNGGIGGMSGIGGMGGLAGMGMSGLGSGMGGGLFGDREKMPFGAREGMGLGAGASISEVQPVES